MMQKGISPLISAVMLIAFTISIGGLFAEWSGTLTSDATQEVSEAQEQILDCSSMEIEIVSVDEDYSSNNVDVTLRSDNGGSVEMNSPGQVEVVSLDISDQQDEIQAASQKCNIQTSEDLYN